MFACFVLRKKKNTQQLLTLPTFPPFYSPNLTEEAEIANRLAQMQSGLSRHAVSKSSFNVMGVPQIIRRAGAGSLGGRVAKSEVLVGVST